MIGMWEHTASQPTHKSGPVKAALPVSAPASQAVYKLQVHGDT